MDLCVLLQVDIIVLGRGRSQGVSKVVVLVLTSL